MKSNIRFTVSAFAFLALVSCAGYKLTTPYGEASSTKSGLIITPNQNPIIIPSRDK